MASRKYDFVVASAATTSNKMYVGPHRVMFLVASGLTNINAGTGNMSISVRAGLSETDTHADMTSMTISTMTAKGVYQMPYLGLPYLSLGFGTAVTGTGTGSSISVVVYSEDL